MAGMRSRSAVAGHLAAACVWIGLPAVARPAVDVFSIDPKQSYFDVSGSTDFYLNYPYGGNHVYEEQSPGSLHATLSGSVNAITDFATTFTLSGRSFISPNNSGDWAPAAGGASGAQPARGASCSRRSENSIGRS